MELPCTRCRTAIPSIAKFCPACGVSVQPVPAPSVPDATASGPAVCPGCGILRGSQRKGCDVCATAYTQPGYPAPSTGDLVWVGVRCHFQCRLCGHPSPLNHLDIDGSVSCLRCGLDQVFDVGSWREGLDHAMRCGVLVGKYGKYKQLGVTATAIELVQSGMIIADGNMILRSLKVEAGPGHPPCPRCHHPLDVEVAGSTTNAKCPHCSTAQACRLPDEATTLCKALRGVIAEELALDHRDAKVEETDGAEAIKCAHCAAPLRVSGLSTIVTCEYCGASSRIPRRTMFKLGHDQPVPQLWWLVFSRAAAEPIIEPPPRPQPKRRDPSRPRTRSGPNSGPSRPDPPPPAPPPPRPDGAGVLAALAVVVVVGLLGYRDVFARWRSDLRVQPATGSGSATIAPAKPPPPPLAFAELPGCKCGTVQLHGAVERHDRVTELHLRAVVPSHAPVNLDSIEASSPSIDLGLACDGGRVVVASGTRVFAWSIDRRTRLWDGTLPGPYRVDRRVGGDSRCQRLVVKAGSVTIPTGALGMTSVKLSDGR